MPAKRLTMRKTREILRMRLGEGHSGRAVARSVGVSPSTVTECLLRAKMAGLSWPLPDEVDDEKLEALLYPVGVTTKSGPTRPALTPTSSGAKVREQGGATFEYQP